MAARQPSGFLRYDCSRLSLVALCCFMFACDKEMSASLTIKDERSPEEFVAQLNEELDDVTAASSIAGWVRASYLTDDTAFLAAAAQTRFLKLHSESVAQADQYRNKSLTPEVARSLHLLRLGTAMPAPIDPALRRELAAIAARMEGTYGTGQYCPSVEDCRDLEDLERVMARSRNYDELLDAWSGWRTIAPRIR